VSNLTWVQGERPAEKLDETSRKNLAAQPSSGTSIFDPVLCELAYRWFCTPGGTVLDPFAGGSVRGIVASHIGLQYIGIDLRPEQIAANREQAARIAKDPQPVWITGDSRNIATLCPDVKADLIFSCPPYADLERYSDDPLDLSTMEYPAFLEAYRAIIKASCALLKPNRFACFVVGDVRDRKGFYRGFVADTAQAFADAGMRLYNDAVIVTAVGSLPIRVGKQFSGGRKLGKTHQNVLVFYNGDPKAIKTEFMGECQFGELTEDVVE
jgi:DNA modification methylase